jgi:hypothetical protein
MTEFMTACPFTVTGCNLEPASAERAIKLSHEKYCSASIMLARSAEITHSFDIVIGGFACDGTCRVGGSPAHAFNHSLREE